MRYENIHIVKEFVIDLYVSSSILRLCSIILHYFNFYFITLVKNLPLWVNSSSVNRDNMRTLSYYKRSTHNKVIIEQQPNQVILHKVYNKIKLVIILKKSVA